MKRGKTNRKILILFLSLIIISVFTISKKRKGDKKNESQPKSTEAKIKPPQVDEKSPK